MVRCIKVGEKLSVGGTIIDSTAGAGTMSAEGIGTFGELVVGWAAASGSIIQDETVVVGRITADETVVVGRMTADESVDEIAADVVV